MLTSLALARLERLQLSTTRRLAGEIAGEHRSTQHGSTLDFADFREYVPGDDSRRIDIHQLARLDVLRVKLYEGIDDLTVRIILDCSGSMGLHGKFDTAASLVAGLGAVSAAAGDVISLSTMPATGPPRRYRGRDGVRALVAQLAALEPAGRSPMRDAVRSSLAQRGPAGMTVLVSDLLSPEWHDAISAMPVRGGDILVVHVLADDEVAPTFEGDLALVDHETGERVLVSLTPDRIQRHRRRHASWQAGVRDRTLHVGGRYLTVRAGADVEATLTTAWRTAGVLR